MNRNRLPIFFLIVSWIASGFFAYLYPSFAYAQEKTEDIKPERQVVMGAEYPEVEIPQDEDKVSIDLIFHNKGRVDETIEVWIAESPKDWNARIKTYKYSVMGIHVPADDDKTLTFEAEPMDKVKPGKYSFRVEAKTPDEKFKMAQDIVIGVVEKKEDGKKQTKGVEITTSYPVLRGPSDAKFEFSMEVESKLDQEAVFDLMVEGPEGWDINFKPSYEDKFISSLRMKENENKSLAIAVKPFAKAKAGEYPILVKVTSGNAKAEAKLTVVLTGTYGLEVGTPTGILALDARKGKPSNMSVYVKNTGTSANHNIQFASFAPENWKVSFNPEKIDVLEPDDLKQVEVAIAPPEAAIEGDYSVGVKVEGEKISKPLDFRVTVHGSRTWGWIGIAVIVVVVIGLTGFFGWYGRR